jgi:hypothetical protein
MNIPARLPSYRLKWNDFRLVRLYRWMRRKSFFNSHFDGIAPAGLSSSGLERRMLIRLEPKQGQIENCWDWLA